MINYIAGIIGNILVKYDNALFGLLAPFIAPLFFETSDPVTALILTYSMLPMGFLIKPLGALLFGWIGDRFGRRHALCGSLIGIAGATFVIGCIPLYREVGIWSPLLLALARMLQSFFAGGESVGGAIFVLEQTAQNKRCFMGSLFDASSLIGTLAASGLATLFVTLGSIQETWRYLFMMGSITAVFGLFLRLKASEGKEFLQAQTVNKGPGNLLAAARDHWKVLINIIIACGFSYTTYYLAFNLMNSLVPLMTTLQANEMMKTNSFLLIIDVLLLPCLGFMGYKFGKENMMLFGSIGLAVSSIPFFYLLEQADLKTVILIRFLIVLFGTSFAACYHAWALEQVSARYRYTVLSLGWSIGSQLIGASTSAVCLWLFQKTRWAVSPGIYLFVISSLASYIIYRSLYAGTYEKEPA